MGANTQMDPEGVGGGGPDTPPLKNEIYKIVKVKLSLVCLVPRSLANTENIPRTPWNKNLRGKVKATQRFNDLR